MKLFILTVVICFQLTNQLPVKESTTTDKASKEHHADEKAGYNLENVIEYERYLKEVVNLLESDKEFRKKLDNANEADIRSGKIAQELELVDHNVRSKLDELKRGELDRLRALARDLYERTNEIDREHLKIAEHIDHENEHTFEIDDLRKLIMKTGEDLAEADRRRRDDFKQYELQKEFEKQEHIRELNGTDREKYEHDLKENEDKHKKHEKIHHPVSKDQLEEVWEKQDHMDKEDFDPKKFFLMHDVDGNGFWDEMEVKALFKTELDKVYQQGLPEDDMRERAEEMERMREHVYKEADVNRDRLISYEEFIEQTKRNEYQKDEGWDTVDQQPQYSHEEYLEFERRRQEEIQRMIKEGLIPPHPNMPNGYYPPDAQYQPHPNEIPHGSQQYHQQPPPQQYHQPPPVQYQQHQPAQAHYQQAPQYQQQPQAHHQPVPHPNQQQAPPPHVEAAQQHQQQMQQSYDQQHQAQAIHNQQMGSQNHQNPPPSHDAPVQHQQPDNSHQQNTQQHQQPQQPQSHH